MKLIASIEALKKEAAYSDTHVSEFFIQLNSGARSSKRITYYPDTQTWDVLNEIDDSYEEDLTDEQLTNETHIIIAIERKALFKYD